MRKKVIILVVVALAVLVIATPALADGSGTGKTWRHRERVRQYNLAERPIFALTGVITALDLESGTITVEVHGGNLPVKPYVGGDPLVVLVTDETTYKQWTETGCVPIDASEVSVDDTVSMQGIVSGDTFTANRVTVDVPLSCCSQ